MQRCIPLKLVLQIYVALLVTEDMFEDGGGCIDDTASPGLDISTCHVCEGKTAYA